MLAPIRQGPREILPGGTQEEHPDAPGAGGIFFKVKGRSIPLLSCNTISNVIHTIYTHHYFDGPFHTPRILKWGRVMGQNLLGIYLILH
jgi:hypothetical protein